MKKIFITGFLLWCGLEAHLQTGFDCHEYKVIGKDTVPCRDISFYEVDTLMWLQVDSAGFSRELVRIVTMFSFWQEGRLRSGGSLKQFHTFHPYFMDDKIATTEASNDREYIKETVGKVLK